MPNLKSAVKRLRTAERRHEHNRVYRGRARTAIKKARILIEKGQLEEGREAVRIAVKALDKAAAKGIIHKNSAARRKARLMRALDQVQRAT